MGFDNLMNFICKKMSSTSLQSHLDCQSFNFIRLLNTYGHRENAKEPPFKISKDISNA